MNSSRLKEAFPETYRDFFREYEIVTAANYSMPWSNELIDHSSKFPLVRSKLPLRCYVGIRRSSEPGIRFATLRAYLGKHSEFADVPWPKWHTSIPETQKILGERLARAGFQEGIEIWALSEIARWRSIGFTETFSSGLVFWIRELLSENSPAKTENQPFFENSPPHSSAELDPNAKRELIELAWKIAVGPRLWNTVAQGIRNSVEGFGGPVAYFGGDWEKPLSEWPDGFEKLPLDVWVIYSGVPGNSLSIEEIRQADAMEKERLGKFFQNFVSEPLSAPVPYSPEELGFSSFRNVKAHLNFRGMELLERIGRYGWAEDSTVGRFIENVNDSRALVSMVSEQGVFAQKMLEALRARSDAKIGITPLYSGKHGGSYLIVSRRGTIRNAVDEGIEAVGREFPWTEILYASHEDGDSNEPVETLKNERSDAKTKSRRILLLDNFWNRRYCGYLEALSRKEGEILFDSISRKIYFNGRRLTSKEIPTQNAANDLFERLIEQTGKEIPNRELPASSYSQNRNEMVSKIISPITKFVRRNTESELPLRCLWSITEFRIVLEKTPLRLWLIKHAENELAG